jgi:hypothetical protein
MRRILHLVLIAVGAGAGTALAAADPRGAAALAVTPADEVRAELAAVCARQPDSDEPYTFLGRRALERLEAGLAAPGLDLLARRQLLMQVGDAHLRLGSLDAAEERFRAALALADGSSPRARQRLLRDLALVELRRAETRNCVLHHGTASCLYPIRPGGVHLEAEPARRAAALYSALLGEDPQSVQLHWLLRLSRMLSGELAADALSVPPPGADSPLWSERAAVAGLAALDLAGGAVIDDFDGDGRLDIITTTTDACDHAKAFRNRGDGTFEDVSRAWGLDVQLGGLNLVHADFDNDGRPDLLILRGGWLHEAGKVRNSLLRNDLAASGRFLDVTVAAGLAYPAYPTQTAAWADFDGDGWLDLYVGNESVRNDPSPSQLFRSNRDGTFSNVTVAAGVANMAFAKGVAWGDFDDDGRPDLYVSNLDAPNRLYRNRGDGTFENVAAERGAEGPRRSFATWFFDFDQDGRLDLFVADYSAPYEQVSASYLGLPTTGGRPALYRNEGGRFRDVAAERGLDRPLLPMGANFGDLDNDGWPDLYLGTGVPNLEALMPNVMLRNLGAGHFVDVTSAGGFGHLQKGHGIAFADLNDDGQPELFAQMGGFYPVDAFYNALFVGPGNDHAWLQLELVGTRANRSGLGARITVDVATPDGRRRIHHVASTGGSFGGSPLRQQIGLGEATAIRSIEVRWPGSGTVDRIAAVAPRARYRLVEGSGRLEPLPLAPFAWPAADQQPH